jgi:hypothetical protein
VTSRRRGGFGIASLDVITDETIVIPGHGAVGGKADVTELDQTIAAKPTAAFDAKWGQFLITPAAFTALVYAGV